MRKRRLVICLKKFPLILPTGLLLWTMAVLMQRPWSPSRRAQLLCMSIDVATDRRAGAAVERGAEIVIFMDGDGSDDPADLPHMLKPLLEGKADLVIGSRISQRAEAGAVPPQARLGNWLVSRFISLFYGARLHDVGSFRALRCSTLESLNMREMTFGWPVEMLIKAARARYRILEIPIHYRRRRHGRSKVAGTLIGSVKAAYIMSRTTLRYAGTRKKYV